MTEFTLTRRCTGLCQCCDKEMISKDEIRQAIEKHTVLRATVSKVGLIKELEL